jgi:hypothetical protein
MSTACCISIVDARIRWPERVASHGQWFRVALVNENKIIPGPIKEALLDTCMTEELMYRSVCVAVVITIWYPAGLPQGRDGRVGNVSFISSSPTGMHTGP